MVKISVAIATFNEEEKIADCLGAVKDWVDEIVLVDGSSTDKTREIAKKLGAKVIKTTNKPIFHINKQMAIDKCRGEWILQLDADEIVSKKLKKEILKIIKKDFEKVKEAGFYIPRKNFFLGKWLKKTGQYPDPVIRFFKNGKGRLPCKSVHEQIEIKGKIGNLGGHLLHFPYTSFSEYLTKWNRYTSLEAQKLKEERARTGLGDFLLAVLKSKIEFLKRFFRHKGFQDGFPGFVFSFFSGFYHLVAFIKLWELKENNRGLDIKKDWEQGINYEDRN